jgi:hypothetical protein
MTKGHIALSLFRSFAKNKEPFMQYTVVSTDALPPPDGDWNRPAWRNAHTLRITHYPWEDSGHRPRAEARLLYTGEKLAIIFRVEDRYVRAVARRFQDSVCKDSCVEFFVAPLPGSLAYFNFEVNCGGTMLLYRCLSPEERAAGKERIPVSDADGRTIALAHFLPRIVEPEITAPTTWTVEYHVPFALFHKYFGEVPTGPGTVWRGNFYKCGDQTSHPHWGAWAPVDTPRPNFHVPERFQPILFG